MAALRAYSNTITLDGLLLPSHSLCRRQRGPRVLTNAWCDDGIRGGRGGFLHQTSRAPLFFSSQPHLHRTLCKVELRTRHTSDKVWVDLTAQVG